MRAKPKRPEASVLTAAPEAASDPLARAAARFGLKTQGLSAPVRAALSAMQVELERAEAEAEMLRERLADAEALADRDALIPVLNRRAFLDALQRTTSYVERYGGEAAVLYLDLDDFKQVNDGYGHPAGDAVLKAFGRLLIDNVRETDTVGRIGGDEFGVILVQAGKDDARRKADALADVIAASRCVHEGVAHQLSASIGLHIITRAEEAEDALARADEAMYAVKKKAKRTKVAS